MNVTIERACTASSPRTFCNITHVFDVLLESLVDSAAGGRITSRSISNIHGWMSQILCATKRADKITLVQNRSTSLFHVVDVKQSIQNITSQYTSEHKCSMTMSFDDNNEYGFSVLLYK